MSRVWTKISLGLACLLALSGAEVYAQTYTIGGFTFNQTNTPTHLTK